MAHQERKPIVFPEKKKEKPPIVFLSEKPKIVFPDEEPGWFTKIFGGAARDVIQGTADLIEDVSPGFAATDPLLELRMQELNIQPEEIKLNIPDLPVVPEPESTVGSIVRDLVGFALPFSIGTKIVGGYKSANWIVNALKSGGVGAAAEQVAFSPYEQRLSNLIQTYPKLANPLTEYLQADPEDTTAEARLKMAIEGSILGLTLDTFIQGARSFKAKQKVRGEEKAVSKEAETLKETAGTPEYTGQIDTSTVGVARARALAGETAAAAYQGAARPVSLKTPTKKAPKKKDYFGNRFEVDPNTGVIRAVFKNKKKGDKDFTIVPQEDGTYSVTERRQLNNDELDKLFSEGAEFNTTTQAGREAIRTARAAKIDVPFETTFPNRRAAQDAVMDIGSPGRLPKSLRSPKKPTALTNKRISAQSFLRGKGGFDQSEKFQEELWRAFPEPHIQQKFDQYGKTSMAESVPLWARASKDVGGMRSMHDLTEIFMESEALGHHYKGKGDLSGSKLDEITEDLLYRDQLDATQAQELENWNRIVEGQEQIIEMLESAGHKPKRMSDEQVDIALRKIETDEDTLARRAETEEGFTRESERLRAERIAAESERLGQGLSLRESTQMQREVPRAVREAEAKRYVELEPDDSIGKGAPSITQPTMAGNINLRNINTTDEIKNLINHVAENNNMFMEARRGVMRMGSKGEELRILAEETGLTPEKLIKRKTGVAFNAETAYAARLILAQSAKEVVELAKRATRIGSSEIDLLNFENALARHGAIQEQVAGITAEAGRTLRSFKEIADSEGLVKDKLMRDYLAKRGGDESVRTIAEGVAAFDSVHQVTKYADEIYTPNWLDKVQEIWINSLLSSPSTHLVNITSNTIVALTRPLEYSIAAAIGAIRRNPDRITGGEVVARTLGTAYGFFDGAIAAAKALRDPSAVTDYLTKLELRTQKAVGGKVGEVVRLPGRALVAEDVLFKAVGYRQELWGQAIRKASREGKGLKRAREIVRNPDPEIRMKAIEEGRYQTFTNALEGFGKSWQRLIGRKPGLRFLTPFVRTPWNIVAYASERSPFFFKASRRYKDAMKAGGAEKDLARAKLALGTSATIGVALLSKDGTITGRGPSDYRERQVLRGTGWQPYSIKIGDTYYAYNRFEPLGILFGVAADLTDISSYIAETDDPLWEEINSIAAMLGASVAENLTNKTFLQGISSVLQAVNDPDRYAKRTIQRFLSSFIPTAAYYARKGTDPYARDVRSTMDSFLNRIPGRSDELPYKRNILGEPRKYAKGFGGIYSPLNVSKENQDQVYEEFVKIGYTPTIPSRQIRGVDLTSEQYDELLSLQQNQLALRAKLQNVISSPRWKNFNNYQKEQTLDAIISASQEAARNLMLVRYPGLLQQEAKSLLDKITQ